LNVIFGAAPAFNLAILEDIMAFKTERSRFGTVAPDCAKMYNDDVAALSNVIVRAYVTKFEGQICAQWADIDTRAATCTDLLQKLTDSTKSFGLDASNFIFKPLYKAIRDAIST
jgi:hypothetical protein